MVGARSSATCSSVVCCACFGTIAGIVAAHAVDATIQTRAISRLMFIAACSIRVVSTHFLDVRLQIQHATTLRTRRTKGCSRTCDWLVDAVPPPPAHSTDRNSGRACRTGLSNACDACSLVGVNLVPLRQIGNRRLFPQRLQNLNWICHLSSSSFSASTITEAPVPIKPPGAKIGGHFSCARGARPKPAHVF